MIKPQVTDYFSDSEIQNNGWSNVISFCQGLIDYFWTQIVNLRYVYEGDRTPYPTEVSQLNGAYTLSTDTRRQIRQKIYSAIPTTQNAGIFSQTWKPLIDQFLGTDCQIVKYPTLTTPFIIATSSIGGNDSIGAVTEGLTPAPPGYVYIDLGSIFTVAQLQPLIPVLEPFLPVYFQVFLGYSELIANGSIIIGSPGVIGGPDIIGVEAPQTVFVPVIQIT